MREAYDRVAAFARRWRGEQLEWCNFAYKSTAVVIHDAVTNGLFNKGMAIFNIAIQ